MSHSQRTAGGAAQHQRLVAARHQQGMSMFGWLIAICLFAFAVNLGLTLGPHYMDNSAIKSIIDQLPEATKKSGNKKNIFEQVDKRLKINSIRSKTAEELLVVKRTKTGNTLDLDYEIREPLIGNVEVVLVFKESY